MESDDRPDLVIFNRAMAFAENADYTSVVIVEFKRPERADFDEKDNPLTQVVDYVRQIREGKARGDDGQTIEVPENTPFYCYAIATLTPQLRALAEHKDFKRTPDGKGFSVSILATMRTSNSSPMARCLRMPRNVIALSLTDLDYLCHDETTTTWSTVAKAIGARSDRPTRASAGQEPDEVVG